MKILPNRHFKEDYKKHYAENYEKMLAKQAERHEKKMQRDVDSITEIKYIAVGAIAIVIIFGVFFVICSAISSSFDDKRAKIAELESNINSIQDTISKYHTIDNNSMQDQLNTAASYITAYQNQYFTAENESLDYYASKYLGTYTGNWAEDLDITEPENYTWQSYINKAAAYDNKADILCILYNGNIPVMLADIAYNMDDYGNLGEVISIRKTVLT